MTLPKTNNINHTLWQTSDLKCGTDLSPGLVILAVFYQDRTINMENVHTETGLCRLKLAPSSNAGFHPKHSALQ